MGTWFLCPDEWQRVRAGVFRACCPGYQEPRGGYLVRDKAGAWVFCETDDEVRKALGVA